MTPSWIAPTMAIAPMLTVSDAVTKALTKPLSRSLPVFFFSHSPKRSKASSMPSSSPITVPSARQSTTSIARPLVSAPSSSFSMPDIAPAMAMNMVLTPQALPMEACCSSRNNLPVKRPINPPATMAPVLMSVPSPIMCISFPYMISTPCSGDTKFVL